MKSYLISLLLLFAVVSFTSAQNNIALEKQTVSLNDLSDEYLQNVYRVTEKYGFLEFPISYDESFFENLRTKRIRTFSHFYRNNYAPFYVNVNKHDKSRNDAETSLLYLFNKSNGKYILGIIRAKSPDHNAYKDWLVSFAFNGDIIDYLPIREVYGNLVTTIEAQLNSNLTINVQRLTFPHNDYIIQNSRPIENLQGARIDASYKITQEGKFLLTEEKHYKSQPYSPETLQDKKTRIASRGEIILSYAQTIQVNKLEIGKCYSLCQIKAELGKDPTKEVTDTNELGAVHYLEYGEDVFHFDTGNGFTKEGCYHLYLKHWDNPIEIGFSDNNITYIGFAMSV